MNSKFSTLFFGASSYVLPIIAFLNDAYDLKLVVTTEKESGAVPTYCREHTIPYISVTTLKDETLIAKLLSLHTPFAILADFGLLVPQDVLNLFPKGVINIHPSLLPEYRGPTPGLSALLDGKVQTGISIMLLDKDLDHGPLLGQVTSVINPDDTSATLYPRLFQEGTELLKKVLPDYLDGKITPREQDHTKATFTRPHLTKESGFIDFDGVDIQAATKELPSTKTGRTAITFNQFEQMIRAYYPWPTVWTKILAEGRLKGKIMKFLPNIVIASKAWQSLPLKGKILMQVEGKKPQSYKDFLNGYPEMKEWLENIVGK